MKVSTPLLSALLFVFPVYADSSSSPSGQEINSMMQSSEEHEGNAGVGFQAGSYEGYIMGVSDGLMGTSLYYYCPPQKIEKSRLRAVVTQYLKSHQRDIHVPAGALVTAALIEAFPCKKKSRNRDPGNPE